MIKLIKRVRIYCLYAYNEIYRKLSGGIYRNQLAAITAMVKFAEEVGLDDGVDYVETRVSHYKDKREIKIRSSCGAIRTLRYK